MIANRFNPFIVCGLLMLALGAVTVQSAVLGIDFGSEIIKMAIVKPGAPFHIITDEHSKRKIPALIAFDDERYFGTAASNLLVRKPKHTYANLRWLLGKNISSPQVQRFTDDFYPYTFKTIPERGTVAVEHSEDLEFSTELLVSMVLQYLRRLAEAESKATVKDAVITVPSFWTHKERQALLDAASLAGMNVLSLINQNTAAAVQYGIDFNFKEDTSAPIIFYNMGSSGTEATLAVYSAYNKKQGKQNKTIGQFEVKGVAYDESLGGQAFDQRILSQMVTELNKKVKKSGEDVDVRTVPRSIAKLRLQARRVKEVLSANTETGATIESAYADIDLKWPVTREAFYGWCDDLFERVPKPIEQLLKATGYKLSDVSAVVLLGGSTRIPKVEQVLKQYLKDNGFPSELSKNIDADESMAMGAAFFAANLSTQFRVRQFGASDVHPYPIGVRFSDLPGATPSTETESAPASADESATDTGASEDDKPGSSDSEAEKKTAGFSKRASLFKRFNSLNKRKTVVFTHSQDFQCNMNYDSADILPLGVTAGITSYNVTGLSALADHAKYGKLLATQKPKVQLSFTLTTDGTVELSKAEALLEETVTEKVKKPKKKADKAADKPHAEPKEAAGADDVEKSKPAEGDASESAAPATDANAEAKTDGESAPETKADPKEPAADAPAAAAEDEYETKQVKKTHTIPLVITAEGIDIKPIGATDRASAAAILAKLNAADQHRKDIAAAKNELEAFIYNMRPKFSNDNVEKVTTREQRDEIFAKLDAAQEWLYEQADDEIDKFKSKLKEVRKLTDPVFFRVEEAEQRPAALNATMSMLNYTRVVLGKLEKERTWVKEESRKELADMLKELEDWVEKKVTEQSKKAAHETPAFTGEQLLKKLKPVTTLAADLLKIPKPKPKPVPKAKNNSTANATAADANSTSSTVDADSTPQTEVESEADSATSETKTEAEANSESKSESEAPKYENKEEKKEKAPKEDKKDEKKKKPKKYEL